ncbi:unnamed protein product [Cylindrotheca closterium]|uniref:Uncharacterized protein n=1 Tax=Cylindrotheca closterium TaxID=2856 RepID=A0AAD2CGM5_9STRA|nr:unnamed protein product [Cylindrotheca closterium]
MVADKDNELPEKLEQDPEKTDQDPEKTNQDPEQPKQEPEKTNQEAEMPKQEPAPMYEQEKQGGKCCGGCCDYRRAVVVLCIISIIFTIIGLVNPALNDAFSSQKYPELEEIVNSHKVALLAIGIIHIIMTVVALVGAIIFNFYAVVLYVLWSILNLIVSIVLQHQMVTELLDWIETQTDDETWSPSNQEELERAINFYMIVSYILTVIFTLLWLYPSVFLSIEIKKGIMTKETYPREEMSCCCVSQNHN